MSTPSPSEPSRQNLRRAWLRWTAITAAAMVVGGFLAGMYVAGRYEARLGQISRESYGLREQLRGEEAALRERAAFYQSLDELLRDPSTRVIGLHGTGPGRQAQGRVVWLETVGGHLFVSKLPPAPAGRTYALWVIAQGTPRPAGTFQVNAAGEAVVKIEPVAESASAFAVTLEPQGGAPAPTGPTVLTSER
jgi:hypothetical protein